MIKKTSFPVKAIQDPQSCISIAGMSTLGRFKAGVILRITVSLHSCSCTANFRIRGKKKGKKQEKPVKVQENPVCIEGMGKSIMCCISAVNYSSGPEKWNKCLSAFYVESL